MHTTTATPAHRRAPRTRADALRNRERIVAAAREMFVEHGPEVHFEQIARRAGVGNATVYRHFTDRGELIRQVVLTVLEQVMGHAERALAAADAPGGDPFAELRRFVHAAADERIGALCPLRSDQCSAQAEKDRAVLADLITVRRQLEATVEELLKRVRTAGQLRADIAVGDLMVALSQLTRPLPGTACTGVDRTVHRHLQLFLDGLMAPARSVLPGTAPTLEDDPRPSQFQASSARSRSRSLTQARTQAQPQVPPQAQPRPRTQAQGG